MEWAELDGVQDRRRGSCYIWRTMAKTIPRDTRMTKRGGTVECTEIETEVAAWESISPGQAAHDESLRKALGY